MNKLSSDALSDGDLLLTAVLHQFLRDFDCRGDRTYSWADIQCWPEGSFEKLEQLGLLVEAERARAVKVLDCFHRPVVEPLWLPDGEGKVIGAYSCEDPDCAGVHYIQPEETRQWRPAFSGLCRVVAEFMDVRFRTRELVRDRLTAVGVMRACSRELFISRAGGLDQAQASAELKRELMAESVVLCVDRYPKRSQSNFSVLSLPEVMHFQDGKLTLNLTLAEAAIRAKSGARSSRQLTGTAFTGGELVFLPDRVEFCGEKVLSNARSALMRSILEVLCKSSDGRYRAMDGSALADAVGATGGQGAIAGSIRDFRNRVVDQLRESQGLLVGREDVIETTAAGYRLKDWISVKGNAAEKTQPGPLQKMQNSDHRCEKVLELIRSGEACRLPEIAQALNIGQTVARRLLTSLKEAGRIRFAGAGRGGKYISVF